MPSAGPFRFSLMRRPGQAASDLKDLGHRLACPDPRRDEGEAGHHEQGPEHCAGEPGGGWQASALDRGTEQEDAERDAGDGTWQRREHLRDDQPGADLPGPCAERAHECRGAPRVGDGCPRGEDRVERREDDEHDRDDREHGQARHLHRPDADPQHPPGPAPARPRTAQRIHQRPGPALPSPS